MWTSGIDNVIVEALKKAGVTLVPVVGADNVGFVNQLLDGRRASRVPRVTNPAAVGGAGVDARRCRSSPGRRRTSHTST